MPRRNKTPELSRIPHQHPCAQKRRFIREQDALRASEDAAFRDSSLTLAVYHCEYCAGWHLTSRRAPNK